MKEHINWRVQNGNGTARIEIPEIPMEALREIIVNSFADTGDVCRRQDKIHAKKQGHSEHFIQKQRC